MEPHRGPSRHTAHGSPPVASLAASDGRGTVATGATCLGTQARSSRLAVRERRLDGAKTRRILFAGFVAHMRNERLPKQVLFVKVGGLLGKARTGLDELSSTVYTGVQRAHPSETENWHRKHWAHGLDVLRKGRAVREALVCYGEGDSSKMTSA